jgi:hypothetical protein
MFFLFFSLSKLALDKLALTKLALAKLALAMAKLAVELSSLSPANFFKALTITSLPQFDIFPFDFVFEKKVKKKKIPLPPQQELWLEIVFSYFTTCH